MLHKEIFLYFVITTIIGGILLGVFRLEYYGGVFIGASVGIVFCAVLVRYRQDQTITRERGFNP